MTDVMKGITILEVAEHTFVPAASAILSDWGATVVKVEHAERGDAMRGLGKTGVISLGGDVHILNEHSNRGKQSIGIDLTKPEGRDVLYRLARQADVFLTNKLPKVLEKLEISPERIREANPDIVYVRGTSFGARGPDANRGGYDMTAFWCRAGNAATVTPLEMEGILGQPAPAYGDSLGGMTIAGGICAALLQRERTGHAPIVDVSLLATGGWALSAAIALSKQSGNRWSTGMPGKAQGFNPLVHVYRTKDDRYISFVMLQAFHYWPDFCEHIGRPDLVTDPRFDSNENLTKHTAEAIAEIVPVMASRTFAEWTEAFQTLKGQWAPVQDTLDFPNDPQVVANGYMTKTETKAGTPFELVTTPVQFDEEPAQTSRAPEFNEHGDEILASLGLSDEEILGLRIAGAVT